MIASEVVKKRRRRRRFPTSWLLGIGGLCFLAGFYLLNRGDAPHPRQQSIQQITLVQPPPPQPPEEKKIEPKEVLKPVEKAKVQQDVDKPVDNPKPAPTNTPLAGGLNRPADIGADSFNLSEGSGGDPLGHGGGGTGTWAEYVATHIRRALQKDPRTRAASGYLEVLLSIDPLGHFERAELQSSTGDGDLDAAIRDVLSRLPPLSRGRPANVKALTLTGINLRAAGG